MELAYSFIWGAHALLYHRLGTHSAIPFPNPWQLTIGLVFTKLDVAKHGTQIGTSSDSADAATALIR